jgi:hypothetical protein
MNAKSEAITLEERPRARPGVRSQGTSRSEDRLDRDAVAIGSLYRKGREAILDSVKYHLQAGRKLIQKKHSMSHGEWVPWLLANADVLGFKHRTTASRLMKAAAANDASAHRLDEAEAIQINRRLWGNLAAVPETESKEIEPRKKKSLTKRSATEIADRCIETVRATIEDAIIGLHRAHARRTKIELLFEALGEIIIDVQRRILEVDDEARRHIRRRRIQVADRGGDGER